MKYRYRCKACKKRSIINHPMTDDAKTVCPKCGQPKLVRVIQKQAIIGTEGFSIKNRI